MKSMIIKGGYGGRIEVGRNQIIEVVNVQGGQVCDFFAFNADNVREHLSPGHTRSVLRRVHLEVGDQLCSVLRNPMLELVEDTTGVNDFCVPQCDPQRYVQDFGVSGHRNCRDNLAEAMADHDIPYEYLPEPFNFFSRLRSTPTGRLQQKGSPAKVGDRVGLRALMDVIVAVSACPQDLAPTNNYELTDLELVVRDP